MSRFEKFEEAYNKAIESINRFLEPGRYEPQMNELVHWMLETDANPYAYLPEEWAGSVETAEGFASLLHYIHRVLYDDGDITFVTVNDEPRIVFAHQHDEDFRDRVLTDTEKDTQRRRGGEYKIQVLDIDPNEFGPLYDEFQTKDLMRCFSADAGRNGVDFAVKHYKTYKAFSESWVQQCSKEIAEWSKFYKGC
jgi:hypothetical protein